MPKMKTNRLAYKKIKVSSKGKARHARAGKSHNTGKRSAKRNRQLTALSTVDQTSTRDFRRLLPYAGVKGR